MSYLCFGPVGPTPLQILTPQQKFLKQRYILDIFNDRVLYTLACFQGYSQALLATKGSKLKIEFKEKHSKQFLTHSGSKE